MEHRYAQRQTIELPVMLSGLQLEPQLARICNISLGGVFVETMHGVPPKGTLATVIAHLGNARRRLDLKTLVIHTNTTGAGLMFCDSAPENVDLLAAILTESRLPASLATESR